jgi:hypothetical protein
MCFTSGGKVDDIKVWSILLVKNEADLVQFTLSHLISQGVDGIVIADNMSSDGTLGIIKRIADFAPIPIIIVPDNNPAHQQALKMNNLARIAAQNFIKGWILPGDCDELPYSYGPENVADTLRSCPYPVVGLGMWNHFCTSQDKENEVNPFKRMVWRCAERNPLDKVAYYYTPRVALTEGNHGLQENGERLHGVGISLAIRHFPYRGADHFIRKIDQGGTSLRLAKDLPAGTGQHWLEYKASLEAHGAEAMKQHYLKYFHFTDPENQGQVFDPAPWTGTL